ncbi:butyrophilin subfamily 1 member A1 isoform X2 [Misgurnus anguillicaudatus]|uniref:butyrophilin subfamily 1 member A1 isoform X2 n=1 Tax=Misgurnus anguillicaudatus TaxID=75329 RepID=UPI003CCF2A3B
MSSGGDFCVCSSVLCFIILKTILVDAAGDSFNLEVSPGPIVGQLGSSVILPCWTSPPINTEALEIRWYLPEQFNFPVLLYHDGKVQETQEEQYRNRSSLTLRSVQSNGLKDGDVSLRLENLRIGDAGVFHCYVSGDKSYDSQVVTLNITAVGSPLVLFSQPVSDDTRLNVSCRSSGWFPEPSVAWKSDRMDLSTGGTSHTRATDGTFSVQSWTLVSSSDVQQVFCHLSLSSEVERKGGIDIQAIRSYSGSPSEGPWKALFLTFVIFSLLGLFGFIIYKYREKLTGKKTDEEKTDEETNAQTTPLMVLNDELIKKLRKHAGMKSSQFLFFKDNLMMKIIFFIFVLIYLTAVITLDPKSAHPDLTISKDLRAVRDSDSYQPKESGVFPYELCVCGDQAFNDGQHYWEVELQLNNVNPKDYWLIGLMKQGNYDLPDKSALTPSNGFWFLCSDGPNGFHTSTETSITLSFSPKPQRLGVLLDYDKGQLSFYDITEYKHLLTMNTKFSGSVVPLFNPGVGDISSLKILDLSEPAEASDPTVPLLDSLNTT